MSSPITRTNSFCGQTIELFCYELDCLRQELAEQLNNPLNSSTEYVSKILEYDRKEEMIFRRNPSEFLEAFLKASPYQRLKFVHKFQHTESTLSMK